MKSTYDIRVTSTKGKPKGWVVFRGELLAANKVSTVIKYVVVYAKQDDLPMDPAVGQHWRVRGKTNEKHVVEYNRNKIRIDLYADLLRVTMPDTGEDFIRFVKEEKAFDGLGDAYARAVWGEYQTGTYKILEVGDTEKLQRVIPPRKAQAMVAGWKKYDNLKFLHWFSDHKIPPVISSRLVKYHSQEAVRQVQQNPYLLLAFGMSFKDVDKLAKANFNVADDDTKRLSASVEEALYIRSALGHTVIKHNQLIPILSSILGYSGLASQALMAAHDNEAFVIDPSGDYHGTGMLLMEQVVAARIQKLAVTESDWTAIHEEALAKGLKDLPYALTERQSKAVCTSLQHSFSSITGGAGTGKTTLLRVILRAYQSMGVEVYPMALAGRASKRIKEGTGFNASTIAGFLKNVKLNADKPAIIVIDEASMVDLLLMFRLVTSVSPGVRFLLVGDPDQLPPIGPGLILHDVVKAETTACTELDIVKRQESGTGIPEYTQLVKNGVEPDLQITEHIRFHHTSPDELNEVVTKLYLEDPANTQILGATYSAIVGGINILNKSCQEMCNPDGQRLEFELEGERYRLQDEIRLGDPLIFVDNHWDQDIQNGTMGRLISLEAEGDAVGVVELDDQREILLTPDLLDSIKPAYAVSLHKAQGSSFPRVIIPITNAGMIDRSWVYTALTRAETIIEIVGTPEQYRKAILRQSAASKRDTYLHRLLAYVA